MPHFEEQKIIKYLAVSAALMVCTLRLATAVGEFAYSIMLLLGIILWHNNQANCTLTEEIKGYIKAYGVCVLLMVPSVIFSDSPLTSAAEFLRLWIWRYAVFIIIAVFIKRRDYLVNMLAAFLTVSSIESLFTLVQVMNNMSADGRGAGFNRNVLTLGGILCMVLPLVMVILMDPRFEKKLKKVSAFAAVSVIVGLLCNKSRGAWLTELIVVPVATFRYLKQNKKYLAVVLAVFIGIAGFMASSPRYVQRVKSIVNTTTDRSNADRIWAWRSSWNMFRDHPITGVGIDRFKENYLAKYRHKNEKQGLPHAHNNFIHLGVESGAIGLAGFLYFVGYYLYRSLRNYRNHKNPYDILVFTTFFGYVCLFGLIDYSLGISTGTRIMWFLLAVLLNLKETEGQYRET